MPPDASLASGAAPATVDAAIRRAESIIAAGSDGYRSESPRLDAELLLAALRRCDRARLLADLREPLAADDWAGLDRLARRRAAGEPLAYLVGRRGFHGIELRVNPSVLIPRPETEHLVDWLLETLRPAPAPLMQVLDVGTGSGAIAIAVAKARYEVQVTEKEYAWGTQGVRVTLRAGLDVEVLVTDADTGKPIESLAAEKNCVIAMVWPQAEGEEAAEPVSWCFNAA